MSQMINRGNELIRIDPGSNRIEYSTNSGRTWMTRFNGNATTGNFSELTDNGKEILATTTKGLFYSTNEGRVWMKRS